MKRTKANTKAKALKVHVLTYFGGTEAHADKAAAEMRAAIERVNRGKPQTISTGYLIRAEDLPGIVERMAKESVKGRVLGRGWLDFEMRILTAGFKTVGIDAQGVAREGRK